jgi:radical SAM-linked protein
MSESRQRWRLIFRRDEPAMYLAHLDAVHAWERAMRRGRIPVAVSEGFNPRPKLVFAAPLQLGMLAEHELADLYLAERLTAPDLRARLAACLPPGYVVTELHDVWVGAQALAPQLVAADYRANLTGVGGAELGSAVARLLEAGTLVRERRRDKGAVRYDLRPLLMDLRCAEPSEAPATPAGPSDAATLWMRLRHSQDGGTGRMEEVVAALAEDVGLRFSWFGGDDAEATSIEKAKEPPTPAAAVAPAPASATPAPPVQASATPASTAPASAHPVGQVEVFLPVRERLWLAEELPAASRSV